MSYVCLKVRYATQDAADRALEDVRHERSRGRGRKGKAERRTYFHAGCNAWHLTSMRKAQP